ncbi:aminoadipate-semialdehyde dehydrogenase large subunit [Fusarium subglutinans]|uniref:Aminoadipate-semialdehyde dehydrogenase large subunit n=1 Tax=Gibberella subglutinans TaxID=42677 RepID=A0A8H5P5K9_GIBSU|nr:aminoadipate-semialdehyde dehydrogenase large subunit [Fusarium subglutinans]KAF5587425.1 aminoadipate-semialdehyde dehydrogenase large subunit [Fusarium subglutinans]
MAPVPPMNQTGIAWSNILSLYVRGHKCLGWDCMTTSEQAGIITSATVILIVLLFAYMYYLGRITTAHQEIVLRRQRRRRRRPFALVPTVSLVQLPPVPRFPSQQVSYQPVLYHPPLAPVALPHLQGPSAVIPQQQIPVFLPVQPTTYVEPRPVFQSRTRQNEPVRPIQRSGFCPASMSSSGLPPRHPSWRQRLRQVFGLPLGRASTVGSESVPGTPTMAQSRLEGSHRESNAYRSTDKQTEAHKVPRTSQDLGHDSGPSDHSRGSDRSGTAGSDRIRSPGSAAATVHSDDYDLISNVQLPHTHQNASDGQRSRAQTNLSNANDSNLSDYHNPLAMLPLTPPFKPMERPPTPKSEVLDTRQHIRQLEVVIPGRQSRASTSTLSRQSPVRTYHPECEQHHRGREMHRRNWDSTYTNANYVTEGTTGPSTPQPTHQGGGIY